MTIRFKADGKQYLVRFRHQTTCAILVEEGDHGDLKLVAEEYSQCHDLDHFNKKHGEAKAFARSLRAADFTRAFRKTLADELSKAQAKREAKEQ